MNLLHLSLFHQIVCNDFSISKAAIATGMSQPLATRHLQALEREIATPLFYRQRRRICGLTPAGTAILKITPRVLQDLEYIREVGRDAGAGAGEDSRIVISTTHTYARHLLPPVLTRFTARFPEVQIGLNQGNPRENAHHVANGEAHISVSASDPDDVPRDKVVQIPFARIDRMIVVPARHPLALVERPTLREIGRYPLVTFSDAFSARTRLTDALERAGIAPNIVLSATDAEVIKTYVRQGFGIAVLSSLSVRRGEAGLVALNASHVIEPDTIYLGLRRHSFLRKHQWALVSMIAPKLKRLGVEALLAEPG